MARNLYGEIDRGRSFASLKIGVLQLIEVGKRVKLPSIRPLTTPLGSDIVETEVVADSLGSVSVPWQAAGAVSISVRSAPGGFSWGTECVSSTWLHWPLLSSCPPEGRAR
jgi:hypothetical protein